MQNPQKATAQVEESLQYLLKLKPADVNPSQKAAETVLSVC